MKSNSIPSLPEKLVKRAKQVDLMEQACKGLIDAYAKAEDGDAVDWSDLDAALEIAKKALPNIYGEKLMARQHVIRDLINEVDTCIDVMLQNELFASAFLSASRLEDTYHAGHFEKDLGVSFAEQCPNAKIAIQHGPDFT